MTTIIKSKKKLPDQASSSRVTYPLLPLRGNVLFPGAVLAFPVTRSHEIQLVEQCRSDGKRLIVSHSPAARDQDIVPVYEVGTCAEITSVSEGPGNSRMVTVTGLHRVAIDRIVHEEPFTEAEVGDFQDDASGSGLDRAVNDLFRLMEQLSQFDSRFSAEHLYLLKMSKGKPSLLADRVADLLSLPLAVKQELLEESSVAARLKSLLAHVNALAASTAPAASVHAQAASSGQGYAAPGYPTLPIYYSEYPFQDDDATRIKNLIKDSPHLPPEVVTRATIEADRLAQLPTASVEYGVTKVYLDWLLALPWGKRRPEDYDYDIEQAEKTISSQYYGPTSLKEQILQRLSVRKLQGGASDSPTLCLIGAPGTGKASLAKAIAHALGKELVRISVGGISDVAEIKGSPRTFLGALPGKITRSFRGLSTCEPVVLIEDIDYFNLDNDASVNMALLDAIDTRRNARFLDNYIGIPFDLSKVFFICSVRSFEEIPEQFVPRFEIVELPGYIEREKIVISKKYLIPNLLKRHGLAKTELKFTDKALSRIISNYTQEAGLLVFSQMMEKICRKIALEKLKKPKSSWTISEKNVEVYLGTPVFIPERAETLPEIGTAAGLAWTGAGGELMFIEGLKMKGNGEIITTGSLGEVMKESIQAAHSYVRSKSDMLGIDFTDFNEFDIHIHFPSGAIPKDGPSAGITVCLVIASVMSERPIRNDIAMTGEVTLRGRVLPVAGVKEKVSAAYRAGILHVALPKENQKDTKELPKEILRRTKFTYIERVDELFEICLLDFKPSSYTLEKIFAEEIAKVKSKKKRPSRKRAAAGSSAKK
ncbi:MAG: endopeptidase La [Candidatus Zixiibacteriota bacterium]